LWGAGERAFATYGDSPDLRRASIGVKVPFGAAFAHKGDSAGALTVLHELVPITDWLLAPQGIMTGGKHPQAARLSHVIRSVAEVKVRDLLRLLEDDGLRLDRQRGSHRQYRHPEKPGTVTVAGKPGDDLKAGTLASIFRQAGTEGTQR
jgi:predicted RNA binding protein YcfA (HicA-like mRNA interferase family)